MEKLTDKFSFLHFNNFFTQQHNSFLDDIARISSDKFVPTDQDILRSRIQTTGVIETTFEVESTKFM